MPSTPQPRSEPPVSGVRLVVRSSASAPAAAAVCYAGRVAEPDPLRLLVTAALRGDAAAVRALLGKVAPAMLGVLRAVLGPGDRDLEDVLQDALVGVVQGLAAFRGEATVLHFARSIALRRALDHRRSRARRGPQIELEDDAVLTAGRSPEASLLAARRREAFRALLEELRPEQAEAFAMKVLLGHSVEEIATATGAALETVRSRLRLAKAALRGRIQNDPTLLELSETDDEDAE